MKKLTYIIIVSIALLLSMGEHSFSQGCDNGKEVINSTYNMDLFRAINMDCTQSVPDKTRTEKTGVYAQGDAAFADYAVNIGMAFRF